MVEPGEDNPAVMHIDHVLIATSDLDATAAQLEGEHGLLAAGGGRHDGLGTHNRIVPLGGGYLELIAVADADEAGATEFGRALSARIAARGEGLMGWAVAVDDVEVVAARLGTRIDTIARAGLTARLTGTLDAMADPALPFFIERDAGVGDPGADGDAGGITWIEVAADVHVMEEWLGIGAGLPVRVVEGAGGVIAVGVGSLVLR